MEVRIVGKEKNRKIFEFEGTICPKELKRMLKELVKDNELSINFKK